MPRILLTGATGLIGRQLLPQLSRAGYDVHALVNRRDVPDDLTAFATWHTADLLNATATQAVLGEAAPALLLHLAWPATTGNLGSDVHRRFLHASQALIRDFYLSGGERAVVAGTCFEYDWSQGLCSEEDTPLRPNTLYGACKHALREFTRDTAVATHRSWAWGRIFFVYGPYQEPTRFVPAVIRGLLDAQSVPCTEGTQVRDYLHAADVASGLLHLLESGFDGDCNIGSGEPVTLREIATHLSGLVGGHARLDFGARPTPPGEPPVILADTARLHRRLAWRPRFTLTQGLADTVASFRTIAHVAATL